MLPSSAPTFASTWPVAGSAKPLGLYLPCVDLLLMENGRRDGIRPDIVTYNTLLKAFCKMGNLVRAESLLSEILGFRNDEETGQLENRLVETKA
ncbi:Pentatricopeptide repeat-containing protein [Arachis hypogaea]|uniref:Pentatricopeptide repeat-containing protein n=1 Tax=Arachis hypogaea TaxID=3818 RepID=A0A445DR78_ARAHY|nr:Pentatricopeptide repeat-containing protein [Arachis hypogaea]RYR65684.1 hypothetical protein Ahy_A03g011611 [Arachis hypogaea]